MATQLELSLALCNGREEALTKAKTMLGEVSVTLAQAQSENHVAKQAIISQLQGAAGVRITSPVDDVSNAERTAGQYAIVRAIKGGAVEMTEDEAKSLWREAALSARPSDRQWLLCDPDGLLQEYQANLGLKDWDAFRQWIIETPIEKMGI